MIRYRDSRVSGYTKNLSDAARIPTVQVLKSYGTLDSTGVWPSGVTSTGVTTEVEFSLNIYKTGKVYQGEIYLVNYDTREKINSNKLTYFEQSNAAQIISIFSIESPASINCSYDLIVAVSPTNCTTRCNGLLYAYVPPIYNQGLNIGGPLKTGEVTLCCQDYCCDYDSGECVFYDTADNPNSCCSNYNISSNTAASVAVASNSSTSTNTSTSTNNNNNNNNNSS